MRVFVHSGSSKKVSHHSTPNIVYFAVGHLLYYIYAFIFANGMWGYEYRFLQDIIVIQVSNETA